MGWLADILQELPVSAALKTKLEKIQADYSRLEAELAASKEQNAWLRAELHSLKKSEQLNDLDKNILVFFAQTTGLKHLAEQVGPRFKVGTAKMQHILTQLENNDGYLNSFVGMGDGHRRYGLSDKGREYLVLNDLIQ